MAGFIVDLADYFADMHRGCDAHWAELEAVAQRNDVPSVRSALRIFERAMYRHPGMEEEILFPAFELATGQHDAYP